MSEGAIRFIDWAAHGGCSKKAPALQLKGMLDALHAYSIENDLSATDNSFSDSGLINVGSSTFLSSLDVVLPMTLDPADFGAITVAHVLSDIYAAGARPIFALCVLGLPSSLGADDPQVLSMMRSATQKLGSEGAALVGGHTLSDQQDLFLGFAAVGVPWRTPFSHSRAEVGDHIVLTKRLGTSLATLRWKFEGTAEHDHADVLEGMRQTNRVASSVLANHAITACTDVSGFGLLGHLHEVLVASGKSAAISAGSLQCYPSVENVDHPYRTQLYYHNRQYVENCLSGRTPYGEVEECLLFDAQVSGGLLICIGPAGSTPMIEELRRAGCESYVVGQVVDGAAGVIELRD